MSHDRLHGHGDQNHPASGGPSHGHLHGRPHARGVHAELFGFEDDTNELFRESAE
jgi:hypothetical protein